MGLFDFDGCCGYVFGVLSLVCVVGFGSVLVVLPLFVDFDVWLGFVSCGLYNIGFPDSGGIVVFSLGGVV